jgi:peptidoglycan/xylan/chitin deacetylase (PgdA/CDA1 family)
VSDQPVYNICFHGIGTPARELEPGEDVFWVGRDTFLRLLDEVAGWPSVRISFDDSNASDLEIGLPALLERGLTADFFVLAGRFASAGSLDPAGVRELAAAGMTIGNHGMHHRPWRGLDDTTVHEELATARDQIAAVVGSDVDTAACPLGRYDRALIGHLRRLGYRRFYTSDRRPVRPGTWMQARYSVHTGDTAESLRTEAFQRSVTTRLRSSAASVAKRWR